MALGFHDHAGVLELFDFDYTLEVYKPKAKSAVAAELDALASWLGLETVDTPT